ncbi:MAG TPA: hypothetical protein O0X42_03735 [Methanocorpusculum sp.]|nr:hypothetical protein [Methanocorpusculum sp.]
MKLENMIHEGKKIHHPEKKVGKAVLLILAALVIISAVFAGTTAADPSVKRIVFFYENVSGSTGLYASGEDTNRPTKQILFDDMKVLYPRDDLLEAIGTEFYNITNGSRDMDDVVILDKLNSEIVMYVHDYKTNEINYAVNKDNRYVPQGSKVSFELVNNIVSNYDFGGNVALKFTSPNPLAGERTYLGTHDMGELNENKFDGDVFALDSNLTEGEWSVRAYYIPRNEAGYFSPYAEDSYLYSKSLNFTISPAPETMAVSNTAVRVGEYFTVTVTGEPFTSFYLRPNEKYIIEPGQENFNDTNYEILVGKNGRTTISLKAVKSGTFSLQICSDPAMTIVEEEREITINKAKITATADKDSYTMGTDIVLNGTNEGLYPLYYYIEGVNLPFTRIEEYYDNIKTTGTKIWETKIKGDYISYMDLDTGGYTIYISSVNETGEYIDKDAVINKAEAYTAVPVYLKKPVITITSAPSAVTQGDTLTIKGTAEGANWIQYYIFGNNFFYSAKIPAGINDTYIIEKTIEKEMFDSGQYYMVIQHPMYDNVFNIAPVTTTSGAKAIALNNTGEATADDRILFTLNERQSSNAAQALCDAIDSEDIDDIWTKCSFVVVTEGTIINPVPSEVIKGYPLTVSGVTNKVDSGAVIVELVSTLFSAQSKYDTVPGASYSALTAVPNETTGEWAVTFSTGNLNVDEYSLTVTTGTIKSNPKSIRIIENSSPLQTAAEPSAVPTPSANNTSGAAKEAKTPGFTAAAVLFGVGAAVLLKRRQ